MKIYRNIFIGAISFVALYAIWINFLFPALLPFPEEVKKYVQTEAMEINSIDPNYLHDDDLIPLKKSIGQANLVFLGEQDHGDAATFQAKTRIVKYLHKEMNFDVLVFESDFYALNRVWQEILNETIPLKEYKKNIYSCWTYCSQCSDLFAYIDSCFYTGNRITITGVDPRHVLDYSRNNYIDELKTIATKMEVFSNEQIKNAFFATLTDLIENEYQSRVTRENQLNFYATIEEIKKEFKSNDFWHQEMNNLAGFAKSSWDTLKSGNSRDIQMGENLLWLNNNKFKDHKIIFWAHNAHILKNFSLIKSGSTFNENDTINTGTLVFNRLLDKNNLFVVGFSSCIGWGGDIYSSKFEIYQPKSNFFESWMSELNYDYAYINFKDFNNDGNKKTFLMKGITHSPMKADWTKAYDGVFYIKEMYPCIPVTKSYK